MDEKCKAAFIAAGYWPNELMWKVWQQAWTCAVASVELSDAERYRFLRSYSEDCGLGVYRLKGRRIESDEAWLMYGDLDSAIDDAMKPTVELTGADRHGQQTKPQEVEK